MEQKYKPIEAAKALWSILDDIDTLSDVVKPSDSNPGSFELFYQMAMKRVARRFDIMACNDGQTLVLL